MNVRPAREFDYSELAQPTGFATGPDCAVVYWRGLIVAVVADVEIARRICHVLNVAGLTPLPITTEVPND